MTESLKDFIARRRREIDIALTALRKQTEALQQERRQLHRAAVGAGFEVEPVAEEEPSLLLKTRRRPKGAIKKAVLKVLSETPGGLMARDILFSINAYTGMAYERSSLSPQLSRLKADGEIELSGDFWHMPGDSLKDHLKKPSDPNLFDEKRSEGSIRVPEAQGAKAPPGGGTR